MCAHYTYTKNEVKFRLRESTETYGTVPRESVRPTAKGPVIVPEFQGFACHEFNWGWSVPWDRKPLINAKSETLIKLPTFKPHLEDRCLILADGFYEGGVLFHQHGKVAFCIAGLWRKEADVQKFTMLTTSPNGSVEKHHDRMPFIVKRELLGAWLEGDWQRVLAEPDMSPLELFRKQPELF